MNYNELEKVICETIKEEQIKLGYERETIRLYFPMSSLAHILGDMISDTKEMDEILQHFIPTVENTLGKLVITHKGDRYCILIPPDGATFVHDNYPDNPFLKEFIRVVSEHHCTMEQLIEVFYHYSDQVVCEKSDLDEFDYVLYFNDSFMGDYRYCIKFEGSHTVYHRFTKSDYESL